MITFQLDSSIISLDNNFFKTYHQDHKCTEEGSRTRNGVLRNPNGTQCYDEHPSRITERNLLPRNKRNKVRNLTKISIILKSEQKTIINLSKTLDISLTTTQVAEDILKTLENEQQEDMKQNWGEWPSGLRRYN